MTDLDAATRWVRSHVDSGFLPGAVLGVANRDGVLAVETWGDAHADDHYPLFSISKPLVGLVAAQHLESGRLSLDSPLSEAIPAFGRDRDDRVALRHLGSHTSGIPEPDLDDPVPLDEALLAPGRDFVAGTACRYSSLAFQGIVRMIEHADGRAWETQLSEVLARAGATGVTLDASDTPRPPVQSAEASLDWESFARVRHPGAGAAATMADMLAIATSLLRDDGALVSPSTLAAMRAPLSPGIPDFDAGAPPRRSEWAFTWNLRSAMPGLAATDGFGHAGWAGTEMWVHPDHDVAYVLLTNVLGAEERGLDPLTLASALTA